MLIWSHRCRAHPQFVRGRPRLDGGSTVTTTASAGGAVGASGCLYDMISVSYDKLRLRAGTRSCTAHRQDCRTCLTPPGDHDADGGDDEDRAKEDEAVEPGEDVGAHLACVCEGGTTRELVIPPCARAFTGKRRRSLLWARRVTVNVPGPACELPGPGGSLVWCIDRLSTLTH